MTWFLLKAENETPIVIKATEMKIQDNGFTSFVGFGVEMSGCEMKVFHIQTSKIIFVMQGVTEQHAKDIMEMYSIPWEGYNESKNK